MWAGLQPAGAPQPVPFSHKKHAPLKLACTHCHARAEKAEKAGFPAASQCMVCHVAVKRESPDVRRLATLPRDARPFPSSRVWRIPDFVFFSHARHAAAKVECASCHGPVAERDEVQADPAPSMKFCVDCHKARQATITCTACHELSQ